MFQFWDVSGENDVAQAASGLSEMRRRYDVAPRELSDREVRERNAAGHSKSMRLYGSSAYVLKRGRSVPSVWLIIAMVDVGCLFE